MSLRVPAILRFAILNIIIYPQCHSCNSRTRDALRANKDVEYIEYNGEYTLSACTVQNGATWVSCRVSDEIINAV